MFIVLVYGCDLLATRKHMWSLNLDVASRAPRDESRHLCSRPCEFSGHESLKVCVCVYVSHCFVLCVCVCVCVCVCLFVCILFVQRVWTSSLGRCFFFRLLQSQWKIYILPGCGLVCFVFGFLPPIVYTMFPFESIPRVCAEWGWHYTKSLPKLYIVHCGSRKVILATFVICKGSYFRLSITCSVKKFSCGTLYF